MRSSDARTQETALATTRIASGSPWLPLGAAAACADALLGAAAAVSGFTAAASWAMGPIDLGEALGLATMVPQALVLAGLFFVARDAAGSLALWRGSVGCFGCFWLVNLLAVAEGPRWWHLTIGITVLAGVVLIVAAVFAKPWVMAEPVFDPSGDGATTEAQRVEAPPVLPYAPKQKSDLSWLWVGIALVVARHLLRRLGMTYDDAVALGGLALLVAACGFLVWLAVTKLRLAGKLGTWGTVSGCADLALAAGSVGMMAWVMLVVVLAEFRGEGEVPDDDPRLRTAELAWEALAFVWKLTLAALLWSVWRQRRRAVGE